MGFEAPKISWLQEIFDIHLLIALGTSLKIFDEWFECLLMQTISLFSFEYGWHISFAKLKRPSRKLTAFIFVLNVMVSRQHLKSWNCLLSLLLDLRT